MFSYAIRRVLGAIPTLFIIITLAFFMMRRRRAGRSTASAGCRRKSSRTSRRPTISTSRSTSNTSSISARLAHGDLGPSYKNKDFTVTAADRESDLPVSLQAGLAAMALAITVGVNAGRRCGAAAEHWPRIIR